MKRIFLLFMALYALLACRPSFGQDIVTTQADRAVAMRIMDELSDTLGTAAASGRVVPLADMMVIAAKSMIGTRYVAGTLDEDPIREDLRIYLTKTDCILFVETCLNLARTVLETGGKDYTFNGFASRVAQTRYRCKPPYSYGDRIHYTTEWIRRQEGRLRDLTMDLGGEVYDHPVDFMSSNSKLYKQLENASNIPRAALDLKKIEEAEERIGKVPMTYIPKDKVADAVQGIKTGDIICFVSGVKGLDVSHVAIAYVENGKVGFIHASQTDGKVEIDKRTILEYVSSRSNLAGIKVVRPA